MSHAVVTAERCLAQAGAFWHTFYLAYNDTDDDANSIESQDFTCKFDITLSPEDRQIHVKDAVLAWLSTEKSVMLTHDDITLVGL